MTSPTQHKKDLENWIKEKMKYNQVIFPNSAAKYKMNLEIALK